MRNPEAKPPHYRERGLARRAEKAPDFGPVKNWSIRSSDAPSGGRLAPHRLQLLRERGQGAAVELAAGRQR
jgi:hypothetical protein